MSASITHTEAAELVAPFQSVDEARSHLFHPFFAPLWDRPYVCATDGHTAAAVQCADACLIKHPVDANPPPPLAAVVPASAQRIGHLLVSQLEALREIPRTWNASVIWEPGSMPTLGASRIKKVRGKEHVIKIVSGAALMFPNTLERPVALNVGYLLRALAFCELEMVTLWREPGEKGRDDELAPIVFTPGAREYAEAPRFAIVMPVCK